MKFVKRLICALIGHKPGLPSKVYYKYENRFLEDANLFKCKRCMLHYQFYGLTSKEFHKALQELIKDTISEMPQGCLKDIWSK